MLDNTHPVHMLVLYLSTMLYFIIYIRPLRNIINTFPEIKYHLYADNILLYICNPLTIFFQ